MTALGDFVRRHSTTKVKAFVGGMVALELVMLAVSAPAAISTLYPQSQPKVHEVADTQTGKDLVSATTVRLADQFSDMKRILDVVEDVASSPMSGADKMRAVTLAARQMQALTPDGGAKSFDGVYFTSPGEDMTERFSGVYRTLNEDKKDLANAMLRLTRIQNALLTGDEEDMSVEMIELEAAVARYEARHPEALASTPVSTEDALSVLVERAVQEVQIDRPGQFVEIERGQVPVVMPR